MGKKERCSVDQATQEMIELACEADVPIAWDRLDAQSRRERESESQTVRETGSFRGGGTETIRIQPGEA